MNPEQFNLSEADTRAKLTDPAIHKRGWSEDLIRREETGIVCIRMYSVAPGI